MITICWKSVSIYKLDGNYLQTVASLSEGDCSQSESYCDGVETGCLLPVDPSNYHVIEIGCPEFECVAHSTHSI